MAQLKDTVVSGSLTVDGNIILKDVTKLFYELGDTIDFTNNNAVNLVGYVDSQHNVIFTIPITRPVMGTPNARADSKLGFVLRQNGNGCCGSTPQSFVMPKSCVATRSYNSGIVLTASFEDNTNLELNSPIAVHWDGYITFY